MHQIFSLTRVKLDVILTNAQQHGAPNMIIIHFSSCDKTVFKDISSNILSVFFFL